MCEAEVTDYTEGRAPNPVERAKQRGLPPQTLADLSWVKAEADNSDSNIYAHPKVIGRQATINIGTIGHVAHGKSTVVNAISGVKTTRFEKEAVMNMTIHLGYANAKIYKCSACPAPQCYQAFKSSQPDETNCGHCGKGMTLERHVSFLDCPGHEILMATMLNGAAIMDAALLLIAANEPFPQPQTREHLHAAEIMHLPSVLVLQNKIDLVREAKARLQYGDIKAYLSRTLLKDAPVIPICAQLGCQLDVVLEHICHFPIPKRQLSLPARMVIVRSFDVNRPGEAIDKLQGGVVGGSIIQGFLAIGEEVEIRPGLTWIGTEEAEHQQQAPTNGSAASTSGNGKAALPSIHCEPIFSAVTQLQAEDNQLHYAIPGGLIAVGTKADPSLTRQNKLSGHVMGAVGSLPPTYVEVVVQFYLLSHLVGAPKGKHAGGGEVDDAGAARKQRQGVQKPYPDERLKLTIGADTTGARVVSVRGEMAKFALAKPVTCEINSRFCMSRMISHSWRLVGWGTIRNGVQAKAMEGSQQ